MYENKGHGWYPHKPDVSHGGKKKKSGHHRYNGRKAFSELAHYASTIKKLFSTDRRMPTIHY